MAEAKVVITAEDRTKAAFRSAKLNVEGFASALSGMRVQLGLVAGLLGTGAMIKSQIDLGEQLNKTSQKVGISVENLSAYQYAAKLSDVSNESLTSSLSRLAKAMQEASQDKGGETARFFQSLGVNVTDANNKLRDTGAVFEDLSRVFAGAKDGPEKTAAAMKLLGRSGTELIPLMNQLKLLKEEAHATGNIVSTDFARKAEEFNDSMSRLQLAAGRMARGIATAVIPVLADMAEHLAVVTGAVQDYSLTRLIKEQASWTKELAHANDELSNSNSAEAMDRIAYAEKQLADLNKRIEEAHKRIPLAGGNRLSLPGDAAGDKRFEDLNARTRQRLETLQNSFLTEQEQERAHLTARQRIIEEAFVFEQIGIQERNRLKEEAELQHKARMGDIEAAAELERRRAKEKGAQGEISAITKKFMDITSTASTHSKFLFNVNKAAAISHLGINLPETVSDAYKWGNKFGGPLSGSAMAAVAGAAQVTQMNALRKANFGGSTSAPSIGGGTATPVTDVGTSSSFPSRPDTQSSTPRVVNIHLSGDGVMSNSYIRDKLIPAINAAVGDGVTLLASDTSFT